MADQWETWKQIGINVGTGVAAFFASALHSRVKREAGNRDTVRRLFRVEREVVQLRQQLQTEQQRSEDLRGQLVLMKDAQLDAARQAAEMGRALERSNRQLNEFRIETNDKLDAVTRLLERVANR